MNQIHMDKSFYKAHMVLKKKIAQSQINLEFYWTPNIWKVVCDLQQTVTIVQF